MQITVHGKHNHVPAALERFAAQKLARLDKFLDTITMIDVELYSEGKTKRRNHVAEIVVMANGPRFRTKTIASDYRAAIDLAIDRLSRQLTDFKGRRAVNPAVAKQAKERALPPAADLDALRNDLPGAAP